MPGKMMLSNIGEFYTVSLELARKKTPSRFRVKNTGDFKDFSSHPGAF
jgi:hypothetical protein